jgi:hypothetical protein
MPTLRIKPGKKTKSKNQIAKIDLIYLDVVVVGGGDDLNFLGIY